MLERDAVRAEPLLSDAVLAPELRQLVGLVSNSGSSRCIQKSCTMPTHISENGEIICGSADG